MLPGWLESPWNGFDLATYVLSGALGGICGSLLAGYFRGSSLEIGDEYLLASIAVVVIGGTSVSGGKANVPGLWGGALFLVLLLTMLNTFGVSAGIRFVVTGLGHYRSDYCRRGTENGEEIGVAGVQELQECRSIRNSAKDSRK